MADLVAQGPEVGQRWRRALPEGRTVGIGRLVNTWGAPWDDRISRQHVELTWDGARLHVRQNPAARNPVFFLGRQSAQFDLSPGEHFVIGGTTFTLADDRVSVSLDVPQPDRQQTFSSQYLQRVQFRRADAQIEVLSRLPEVISGAATDDELCLRLVNLVLSGVPRAGAVALVAAKNNGPPDSHAQPQAIEVLNWDRRVMNGEEFHPSQRLILDAVARRQSVLHVWTSADAGPTQFTARQGVDWAYCTPVGGKACQGWAIYVAGRFSSDGGSGASSSDPNDLRDDLKFTELLAATLSALRDVRQLEQERAGLAQFFSPVVLEAVAGDDPDVALSPREADVTVLFCDLRGFSRQSERSANDLLGLLNRVSRALGVTTRQIREQGGVLGDFHGDAAMGFWGWPLAQPDAPLRACRAALAIRAEFAASAQQPGDPLADFRAGIGIATGRAVAGKIGTVDQVKVTVFGPVVNLAARLESMTKSLHAPILLDERTASALRVGFSRDEARLRRVAVVRPYGLDKPLEVVELLPPLGDYPQLSNEHIEEYERALDDLLVGRWPQAFERLHRVPADDRVKDFLTVFIAQHNRTPPDNWNGVIPLAAK